MAPVNFTKSQKNEINTAKKEAKLKQQSIALRESEKKRQIARMDMPIGLMQLFSARKIPANKRIYKELPPQAWNGGTIQINGPELDFFDQDVLFAILALAMQQIDKNVSAEPGGLFPALKTGGVADNSNTVELQTSMSELIKMIGLSHGGNQEKEIRSSIKRLSSILVEAKSGQNWATSHLIAGVCGYGKSSIKIRLSWRLTRALLATGVRGGGSYIAISMHERQKLTPGIPRLIHALLCNYRTNGRHTDKIETETLRKKIYGEESDRRILHRQKQKILDALEQIKALPNWQ